MKQIAESTQLKCYKPKDMVINMKEVLSVKDYISKHYPSQVAFAEAHGTTKQQVTEWISKSFIFVGDDMYSLRRSFKQKSNEV